MKHKIWITADTHYNHRKLEVLSGRPADFEAQITINLMNSVQPHDTLIHLGDVCIGSDEHVHEMYVKPIRGTKILVRGNHDHKSDSWYLDHGWDFVCDSFVGTYYGKRVLFAHIPQIRNNKFDFQVHGHTHGNKHRPGELEYDEEWHIEFAQEKTGYKPLLLENIIPH